MVNKNSPELSSENFSFEYFENQTEQIKQATRIYFLILYGNTKFDYSRIIRQKIKMTSLS